jgi:leader peptidase (prepilin peptidase) / N-methyltransferase
MQSLIAAFAALFGLAVGSFLNVVIYRVPIGKSVVSPASACPSCGHPIGVRDNVPVFSWLLLRARCRYCGAPISARYVLVELGVAAAWVGSALRFASVEEAAFVAVSLSVLITLAAIDLEHRRLPNVIVLPATAGSLVWVAAVALTSSNMRLFLTAIAAGAASFALMFGIAVVSRGMGFGDVKLAAFIGVVAGRFGWEVAVSAVFLSFFLGGLVGVALLLSGRKGRKESIPFGPAMAAGALAAIFLGPSPVRTWLGL